MKMTTKNEILNDFVDVINQLDAKPSDEIEFKLQKIVSKIRPHIHHI
ncbi:MAG: hypothetical protein ACE5RO_03540 [Candidatus Nitrosomaritimum yanchengensis]